MQRNKVVILGLVMALALAVSACKNSDDDDAAAAIVGQMFLESMGGASVGGDGGDSDEIEVWSQAQGSLLNWGSFTIPNVVMPAGALMITADTTLDQDMADDLYWGNYDGLYVAPGVTFTIPDDVCGAYYYNSTSTCYWPYVYGVYGYVYGPIVIMGNIVADSTNDWEADFDLFAAQYSPADDNTIVVTGLLDMSGPASDAGDGVDGGYIFLGNDYYQDIEFGAYITGNIISNGGNATDALSGDDGGDGGGISIASGDNADILIRANLIVNGGTAAGDGDGGDGGGIWIWNDGGWDSTPDSAGQIAFFDVNQVNLNGGNGEWDGGDAGYMYLESDRAGWLITAPLVGVGGNSNSDSDDAGDGLYVEVYTGYDDVAYDLLAAPADIIVLNSMNLVGGSGGYNYYGGGEGGGADLYAYGGDIYVSDLIVANGGSTTVAGSYGGDGGWGNFYTYNYDDDDEYGDAFWIVVRDIIIDGGNGADFGGDGGDVWFYNYTPGWIYLPPAFVAARAGTGSIDNGGVGGIWIYGNSISIPFFPEYAIMPADVYVNP